MSHVRLAAFNGPSDNVLLKVVDWDNWTYVTVLSQYSANSAAKELNRSLEDFLNTLPC